jgi:hypothetical protein
MGWHIDAVVFTGNFSGKINCCFAVDIVGVRVRIREARDIPNFCISSAMKQQFSLVRQCLNGICRAFCLFNKTILLVRISFGACYGLLWFHFELFASHTLFVARKQNFYFTL